MNDMGDSDFFWVEEGDLIISGQFAWEGAVALAGKEDTGCVVSHRYPVLHGQSGICHTEYLFALLLTKHGDFLLNENSRGAAGRNRPLNINSLMKEKIPVPDMRIQEQVAQAVYWRKILSVEISKQVDLLQERRTALISAAVTGKIDVRGLVSEKHEVEQAA
jgi:type I restriction enzyme S subunit